MQSKAIIGKYLEDTFLFDFDDTITADTDLFKAGVIDSFGYVRMMKFLEQQFGVEISAEDILTNILVSLTSIDEFVATKIAAVSA
ncbi:hypothetical protein GCM10010435_40340 [Winogradskya consettensis]|uniref:Carrier domain-containing protein n=1 Tax=Winogradskya consettensis TaxID=113560 RepID=A0A919VN90_9ACTN|nr:acyl carrier protein [Actinoplanes consettensis]GIM69685.1 hypothetical protein Aco04nite_16470 [Actinoplanes consettensis]